MTIIEGCGDDKPENKFKKKEEHRKREKKAKKEKKNKEGKKGDKGKKRGDRNNSFDDRTGSNIEQGTKIKRSTHGDDTTCSKKRKRDVIVSLETSDTERENLLINPKKKKKKAKHKKQVSQNIESLNTNNTCSQKKISFPIQYILAPMVGASELAFRLLCRKYGAQAAYTPMMNSHLFATDEIYRREEFQTITEDRPLVCHFSANDPKDFAAAAKLVEDKCDAVDLNLGCPQRTAYLGHFGSYLLDKKDRDLICSIVREAAKAVSIPIFVKIRLLDTIEDTIELCQQLKDAGASLIAIHARYRASFERKGPGARDGPAMLDQVLKVRQAIGPDFPLVSNGNVITFDDVENNMKFTKADGIMSAEGILDSPALYLPQYGNCVEDGDKCIKIAIPSPLYDNQICEPHHSSSPVNKKKRKLIKKLREIQRLEARRNAKQTLLKEENAKICLKVTIEKELSELENSEQELQKECNDDSKSTTVPKYETISLRQLYEMSDDKLSLALEYINLVRRYPTKLRSVIFHIRRMLKQELNEFQLMNECILSKSIDNVEAVIKNIRKYKEDPSSFHFDKEKEKQEKEAFERKRREEGKRKAYEARMIRKAKREGKTDDLEYYLRQGAEIPTIAEVKMLRKLSREEQMQKWKDRNHQQHCMAFHLDENGCKRDRSCAFLHADALGENSFQENDEVAG